MKSLVKPLKKFFKSFWKSFDKKIITPISKVILKFTDNNDNSGKTFENWLSKRNTLLFISLFLAIITFIVITTDDSFNFIKLNSFIMNNLFNNSSYIINTC